MRLIDFSSWSLWLIIVLFIVATYMIFVAGTRITSIADRLADATGLGEAVFGAIMLVGVTSLPGIITSVLTAHWGYPQLSVSNAVGGIAAQTAFLAIADMTYRQANLEIGGNSFDVLFIACADFFYRDGSIYHAISQQQVFVIVLTVLLTGILLLGLLRREKSGVGNIGFESLLVLSLYFGGIMVLVFT